MKEERTRDVLLYGAAFVIICLLFTIVYTRHLVQESELRDCGNLRSDIEAYIAVPPVTPTGWGQLSSKAGRYREIGCTPRITVPVVPPSAPNPQPSR